MRASHSKKLDCRAKAEAARVKKRGRGELDRGGEREGRFRTSLTGPAAIKKRYQNSPEGSLD